MQAKLSAHGSTEYIISVLLCLVIDPARIIENYIIHYTVHPEVSKGGFARSLGLRYQPERSGCRELCNA